MRGFRITLKSGYVETDDQGRIVHDYSAGRNYRCEPHDEWRIVGIATRHHSIRVSTLDDCAADPRLIGQGWIHDLDHGTRRMWAMPTSRRAVRVERLT